MTTADVAELAVLGEDDCIALLMTRCLGRIGVNAEHYPLVFCVNYAMDGDVVIIRAHSGTLLDNANHANVCFEVDEIDDHTRSGWTVLVRGLAERVTDHHRADLIERTKSSGVLPWAPGEHGEWLRLIPHQITGRRIVPGHLPPPFPDAAYL